MTPTHYQTGDRPHAMDIIESFLADDTLSALEGFYLGNILKYLYRYKHKGDADRDLYKAADYVELLREHDGLEKKRIADNNIEWAEAQVKQIQRAEEAEAKLQGIAKCLMTFRDNAERRNDTEGMDWADRILEKYRDEAKGEMTEWPSH